MRKLFKHLGTTLMASVFAASVHADPLVIGGKNFTEQQLLTEMTAQYLDHQGYDIERRAGMGSAVLRKAQENDQIDLYWEYTGTSLIVYNKVKDKITDPKKVYEKVRELDAKKGLAWLDASAANNTYALAMRRADAEAKGISSLSDLAQALNKGEELVLATNAEWYSRKDGYKQLKKAYDFDIPRSNIKRMDSGLTYVALKEGQVDIALVFATDGRIPAFDFKVLEDDKGFFPNYAITPVVRQAVLDANPELADQLNTLSAQLDNDTMSALNAQVDVERTSIEDVARQFLNSKGLL
ncbi:glycine betaine ABC transporter substrate-binding protein [Marinobacterium sp. AK62]|uniref:Glycine betaine ABC transporter substrate-binding protein n=1 Tax=Marinobacterium alkalitolerans TaxID=1542925 RepID=A0ABS3Z9A7_9GAMM|nr:glycine betaine ABC transporter substrate-binding protein [Marinobacterium alkalitolerans]MBP0048274.1 glycine betaine ABC transporter substrate-binding protein [Marinobacterium alkalitolerans]